MEFKSNETILSQIVEYMKKQIFASKYLPGQKILPIREFASFCSVNPNTVAKAYVILEEENLIYTDSTLGKFVTNNKKVLSEKREKYLEDKVKLFKEELKKCGVNEEELLCLIQKK